MFQTFLKNNFFIIWPVNFVFIDDTWDLIQSKQKNRIRFLHNASEKDINQIDTANTIMSMDYRGDCPLICGLQCENELLDFWL